MKRILLTFLSCVLLTSAFAQTNKAEAVRDSLLEKIYDKVWSIELQMNSDELNNRFKLYKTNNMYTFLRLDTATGKIKQFQWSLKSEEEGYVTINDEDLSFLSPQNGTFELYPTENMYQFLLLDKSWGRMWHVQWGFKSSERWIREM
jgi:hypothetical protein